MRRALRRCRGHLASPLGLCRLFTRPPGDRIDKRLVVDVILRDQCGLPVGLIGEGRRSDIWDPDLHRAQPLSAEALAMLTYTVSG